MKITKLEFCYEDSKYDNRGTYCKVASSLDSAVKYIEHHYPTVKDITEEYLAKNPFLDDEDKPLKVYRHTKERVDEDGDWDYPILTEIRLYSEKVIE